MIRFALPALSIFALAACSSSDGGVADAPAEAVAECPAEKWLTLADYDGDTVPSFSGDFVSFLVENGAREGVSTTDSGLQYKVVQEGVAGGLSPARTDPVIVHYHGYFPDGEVFDSSYERDETIDFEPGQVIGGWTEALMDMSVCEARTLYIPGDLAYGPQGRPGIPPNATLLFNVQILGVDAPVAAAE